MIENIKLVVLTNPGSVLPDTLLQFEVKGDNQTIKDFERVIAAQIVEESQG